MNLMLVRIFALRALNALVDQNYENIFKNREGKHNWTNIKKKLPLVKSLKSSQQQNEKLHF